MDAQQKERLEILDGSRSRSAIRKAAVRIEDLTGILELSAKLKSVKAAGAAPTAAEFDALVDDVAMLQLRLLAVAQALQARLLP